MIKQFYARLACLILVCGLGCSTFTSLAQSVTPAPLQVEQRTGCFVFSRATTMYTNLKPEEAALMEATLATWPVELKRSAKLKRKDQVVLLLTDRVKGSPEGYVLTVTPKRILVESASGAGLFYGLQSLLQCAQISGSEVSVPAVCITDAPRLAYRGLMLDVSRHFFSKEFVKKQLDVLAYYKMNRLHLHLTDAAGWRIEIKRYPELTRLAAWRTEANWKRWWFGDRKYLPEGSPGAAGGYYTQEDIRELVAYAQQRYITLVPEIEMPGHSEEVLAAYPELSCAGEPYKGSDFCVGNEQTFTFLKNVLTEVMALFPSTYIHIGGDEAGKEAWKSCPKCQKRIAEAHLEGVDGLQSDLIHRVEKFLNAHGRRLLGWDEILQGGLAPDATVMSWRGEAGGIEAVRSGHQAIMTPGAFCYLDAYQDAPSTQPEAIGGYLPLEKVYGYNPVPDSLSTSEAALVLGVQGNLWTEYVPTPEHAEYMLYPRLLALAEVGWSAPERKSWPDFKKRALEGTTWLQGKGYHPFNLATEVGKRLEAQTAVSHLAVGKKVLYNAPYSSAYAAKGATTLTDGWLGDWTYGDGSWQGFISSKGVDVTLDLEVPTVVHSVSAEFIQAVGPDVYWPGEVTVSVSDDGVTYRTLNKEVFYTESKEPAYGFKQYGWSVESAKRGVEKLTDGNLKAITEPVKARYIRYQALPSTVHHGWLFVSEIVVK